MADKKQTHKKIKTTAKSPQSRGAAVLSPPGPGRQVAFYQLLVAARKQWFIDALRDGLKSLDQAAVKDEILRYVPADAQRLFVQFTRRRFTKSSLQGLKSRFRLT